MNIVRNFQLLRVLWRMHRLKPTFISFNVTNRCNERCAMCTVWRTESEELTIGQMDEIFRMLRKKGLSVAEISGGEPFLREDLFSVFEMLDRQGFLYTLNTNGTLLTSENIRRLGRLRGLLQVAVSLDSLNRKVYERLRGKDMLTQVMKNLVFLKESGLKVPVKINFAMSRVNYGETIKMLAYAGSAGFYLSVFPVNQGAGLSHRHDDDLFAAGIDERRRMSMIFKKLAELRREGAPLWEYSGFYELASNYVLGKQMGPCDAGSLYFDLHADGGLAVCIDQQVITDLRRETLNAAESKIAQQTSAICRCHEKNACCYTCTYNISVTARHEIAFIAETFLVRIIRPIVDRIGSRKAVNINYCDDCGKK